MVISSETWQAIDGLFLRGSKASWQSLRRGTRRDLIKLRLITMCSHSIQCPLCLSKVIDPDEIEFVKDNGRCFICDHHSAYDDMSQAEFDDYLSKQ